MTEQKLTPEQIEDIRGRLSFYRGSIAIWGGLREMAQGAAIDIADLLAHAAALDAELAAARHDLAVLEAAMDNSDAVCREQREQLAAAREAHRALVEAARVVVWEAVPFSDQGGGFTISEDAWLALHAALAALDADKIRLRGIITGLLKAGDFYDHHDADHLEGGPFVVCQGCGMVVDPPRFDHGTDCPVGQAERENGQAG